jgi:replication initiator protein A
MQTTDNAIGKGSDTRRADKLYMESTLLRIAGALFCHDPKIAAKRTEEIELNKGIEEKHIVIRPDPKLGQPGQLAHKVFVALIKKHSDYGRPVQNQIHFTRREIGRLIGRTGWGGRESEQLSRALHEIHYTFVKTYFKQSGGNFVEHSFSIFPEILIERREFPSDPIEACTITLAPPIVSSLQDKHFTCLNHALMQQLGTIGQALYMRTFFHFGNHYTGVNRSRLSFQKRYDDVCAEWLGGLKVLKYKADIVRDQLGPHLNQLIAAGFLSSYDITKARGQNGLVITFTPGAAFFADYDRFYRRRAQGELQWEFRADERQVGDPLKFAYLFIEKRDGCKPAASTFVTSKEKENARQLLTEISIDEAPAFLDFALAAARQTNFDVQTLGGLRAYLPRYKAHQATLAMAKREKAARRTGEDQRLAYDGYRRHTADAIFETLTDTERQRIDALAQRAAIGFSGSLADAMQATKRRQIIGQRYGDRIKTFEEWITAR